MTTILFARTDSVYKSLDCDVWDKDRNARLFDGPGPIIAHPPCRAWGRFAHRSKHDDYEKSHAIWSIEQIRRLGGVMEHPAFSRVWELLDDDETSIVLDQHWFGHPARKRTRLFYNLPTKPPQFPLRLERIQRPVEFMSEAQREHTPRAFAQWLLDWCNQV